MVANLQIIYLGTFAPVGSFLEAIYAAIASQILCCKLLLLRAQFINFFTR